MKIFINDIPVYIKKIDSDINQSQFDFIIDGKNSAIPKKLMDDVLIWDASVEHINELLQRMTVKKFKELDNITFAVANRKEALRFIKKKFKVVKAGGGVVQKDGKVLLIHRLGKWDLPKGKLDKGELVQDGALREVEEETAVRVVLEEKICSTWHTYIRNNKFVLKKTKWYKMGCIDDSGMQPQLDEDIDDLRWMDVKQTRQALYNSYRAIRFVIQEYYKTLYGEKAGG